MTVKRGKFIVLSSGQIFLGICVWSETGAKCQNGGGRWYIILQLTGDR